MRSLNKKSKVLANVKPGDVFTMDILTGELTFKPYVGAPVAFRNPYESQREKDKENVGVIIEIAELPKHFVDPAQPTVIVRFTKGPYSKEDMRGMGTPGAIQNIGEMYMQVQHLFHLGN